MHGVLNLLKPPGMSSHDVVARVRRVLGEKRVGHTGTLDPAAAGVLPVCVGQGTRLVEYLQAGSKEYRAEMLFGMETDSGDLLGQTTHEVDAKSLVRAQVEEVIPRFLGEIEQVPPLHSAIKVDGQRLYDIARSGGEAEIPTRRVHISRLEIVDFARSTENGRSRALIHVECSGGTYIRSLIRDLARAAGTLATMSFLVRTRSGSFGLHEACSLEELSSEHLLSLPQQLENIASWSTSCEEHALALWQGRQVPAETYPALGVARMGLVRNMAGNLLALVEAQPSSPICETARLSAVKVFDLR